MMTEQGVNERFKNAFMHFNEYYKYRFSFVGQKDGFKIRADIGGTPNDIYRERVMAMDTRVFGSCENWTYILVTSAGDTQFEKLND